HECGAERRARARRESAEFSEGTGIRAAACAGRYGGRVAAGWFEGDSEGAAGRGVRVGAAAAAGGAGGDGGLRGTRDAEKAGTKKGARFPPRPLSQSLRTEWLS